MQKNFDNTLTKPEVNDEYNDIDIISIVGEPPVLQEQLFSFLFGNAGNIRKHESELRAWKTRYNRTKEREDQAKADKQQLQLLLQNHIQQNSQVLAKTEEQNNEMAQLIQKVNRKEQNTASTGDDFLSAVSELKETIEMQAKILSASNMDNFNFFINSDCGKTYCDRLGWNDKFKRNKSLEKCVDYNIILRNKVLQAYTEPYTTVDSETKWNRIIDQVKINSMNLLYRNACMHLNLPVPGYCKSHLYKDILASVFIDYLEEVLSADTLGNKELKKGVKNSLQYISRVVRVPGIAAKPKEFISEIETQIAMRLKSINSGTQSDDNVTVNSGNTTATGKTRKVVIFCQLDEPEVFYHNSVLERKLVDSSASLTHETASVCSGKLKDIFSEYLKQEEEQTEESTPIKTPTSTKSCQSPESNISSKSMDLQLAEKNAKVNMVLTAASLKTTGTLFKSPQMNDNTDENKSPSESNKGSTPSLMRNLTG